MAVYLDARDDLPRFAFTFGFGDGRSQLAFTASPGAAPSLAQDTQPGAIAAAWLNGLSLPSGGRLLLGYVSGPGGALSQSSVYGLSASNLENNQPVRIEGPAAPAH